MRRKNGRTGARKHGATTAVPCPTVADQLLDYLALEGVSAIFGVPGAGIMHLLQRLHDRPEFTYVICRHETGAAYMADGYHRATGKPGVVLVTSGPGATNALTGTMNANFGGSALLLLTGEVPQQFLGRGYLQEGTDCGLNIRDIYAAATRYSADIEDASGAPIAIEQALRDMLSLPRRAVHLSIPDNVAATPVAATAYVSKRPPASPSAYRGLPAGVAQADINRALAVLTSAKRPLILLGNGCREAVSDPETAHALRRLAEWWNIPVMTTSDGKGVFPEDHPLSLRAYGFAGCAWPQYWMIDPETNGAAHDALLVIGSSLGELATYKWNPILVPNGPFLQVDIDQSVIGRGLPVTDGIVAECGAFLRALWDHAPAWPRDPAAVEARGEEIAAFKAKHSPFASPGGLCADVRAIASGRAMPVAKRESTRRRDRVRRQRQLCRVGAALSDRARRAGLAKRTGDGAHGVRRLRRDRSAIWPARSPLRCVGRRRRAADATGRDHHRSGQQDRRHLGCAQR